MFRLSERINMVTGLQSSMLFDRQGDGRRKEEFELLQVSLEGHKVHIYKEYHSVCMPPRQNLDSPNPSIELVPPPPPPSGTKGGGAVGTLACG
jgi:hypothetical protein